MAPTTAEWNAVKETVRQLYVIENKTRIKQWEFKKKCKEGDMRAVYRISKRHLNEGKGSVFMIRGCEVRRETALHYFERRGLKESDLQHLINDAAPTPSDVCCLSPNLEQQPLASTDQLRSRLRESLSAPDDPTTFHHDPADQRSQKTLQILDRERLERGLAPISVEIFVNSIPPSIRLGELEYVLFHATTYLDASYDSTI